MKVMKFYCKLLCSGLVYFFLGTLTCLAQKGSKVIYRDYTRMEATLLDSLKREGLSRFTGMRGLRQQAQSVKEGTRLKVEPYRGAKRGMKPGEIIAGRRASVLTVNKYQGATTRPEAVVGWAAAVVLTPDGVCVSNYHVFLEMLEPGTRLNPADSVMFVATEEGKVYPITEILSFSKSGDMAIFKIDTRGDILTPMPLGDDLPAGCNVHVLSHPEGYPYAYTNGVVFRTVTLNPKDIFARRMEITADYAKGASGGPIMDDCGNMVAMVSSIRAIFYSNQPPYSQQMNVKLTIPVSSLRMLMQGKNE